MTNPQLSILVVSYGTRDLTLECLSSVYRETGAVPFEILVVDNGSPDGSAAAIAASFPQVRLFALRENLGFGAANNLAARQATGKYLLLLNPDTVVLERAIQKLYDFAERHPEAGIIGGRTYSGAGVLDPTSCWGQPTPWSVFCRTMGLSALFKGHRWFDPEVLGDWDRDTVREVDIVTGCLLLIRKELWDRLQGFDPSFFMYGEEFDLCLRARKLGIRCLFCPDAEIIHYGGASATVQTDKLVRLFQTKRILYQQHWSPGAARFGEGMLRLWALSRMAAFMLLRLIRPVYVERYRTWRAVWRRRGEWERSRANGIGRSVGALLDRRK